MRRLAAAAAALLLVGCSGPGPERSPMPISTERVPTVAPDATATSRAGPAVVATGLEVPWGLAFLPDGSALVTLRDSGEVVLVAEGREPRSVGTVPGVVPGGEGGLLGIAASPDFAQDGFVFVYLTSAEDNRVARMRLVDGELTPDAVVLDGIPRAGNHNGGRLAFGPDGYLYVTTGDAGVPRRAQDPTSLGGKILRIDADGDPAPGNVVPGSPVWSLGHRNVQGIAWDEEGRMFASEFGQNTWDELNLITPGSNYGWPVVEGRGGGGRFVDPLRQWRTADASPSGIAVTGGAVYLAALRGESLWRVPLDGEATGEPQRLLEGTYGRLRAVEVDAAGRLWLLTSNRFRGEPRPGDDQVIVLDPGTLG
ncbi:PQQ-dependent sugar dehydrogenase [Georgenia yuyongxinii]|uniref:PQQ-dependent sugar dehydrogenase n=1 Tax=Georgenia yuyongxinii TaxID=2589797 RepID=A0A552WPN0_9MICO|nr:PQQ-dependent sugar dehydrogenase [Georgenia yuyongxinii]TRW44720.1 PQQ-dependent sugar dehydrogenase [Georgenia yuyongxinii]